jgi:biopolymer transport protein ExbB
MIAYPDIYTLKTYFDMGGFVMIPLIVVSVLLWYGLAIRFLSVKSSRLNVRELIKKAHKGKLRGNAVTVRAARIAVEHAAQIKSRQQLKSQLNELFNEYRGEISRYRSLIRSLVTVAPLLGLLGTVDGMIETFDALGDMALFSQTGGIAGGISRALFTTQMGLAISIPGLLLGRIMERKQVQISIELDQIRDLVCAGPETNVEKPA